MAQTFLRNNKLTVVKKASASDVSTITTAVVDMAGYESVTFFVTMATIAAGGACSLKAQMSTTAGTGFNDLTGTSVAIAVDDDDQTFAVEVVKPLNRYVRAVLTAQGTATPHNGIYAIQSFPMTPPEALTVTDTFTSEVHISPALGTA